MRKYVCDLCGEESSYTDFKIPIATTFVDGEPHDMLPINMNLCNKCRSEIYKTVTGIADKNKLDELNKNALKKKIRYSDCDEDGEDWF